MGFYVKKRKTKESKKKQMRSVVLSVLEKVAPEHGFSVVGLAIHRYRANFCIDIIIFVQGSIKNKETVIFDIESGFNLGYDEMQAGSSERLQVRIYFKFK